MESWLSIRTFIQERKRRDLGIDIDMQLLVEKQDRIVSTLEINRVLPQKKSNEE